MDILDFLRSTVEWKNWGMNILTFSSIGAIIITMFQAWSFIKQSRTIWNKRSGDSVSMMMFGYALFHLMAFTVYGFAERGITIIINGLLFLCVIPIVIGLFKFKRITRAERHCVTAFGMLPAVMFFIPYKQIFLLCLLTCLLVAFAFPAYEIWRNKDAGVVEVRVTIASMTANMFWGVYAFMVGDVPLMIFNPLSFMLMVSTLLLWIKYKRRPVYGE